MNKGDSVPALPTACEYTVNPDTNEECGKPATHTYEQGVGLCEEHAAAYRREGLATEVLYRTTVVNIKLRQPYDVYIGRPSVWGNPFVIGEDGDRTAVIRKFREQVQDNSEFKARIRRDLRGRVLGCHCKPAPCHGDVLAEVANSDD